MACKERLNDIWVDCVDMYVPTGVLYQLKKVRISFTEH